jgi:hypothetical protein
MVPNSHTHMNDILGQPWDIRTLLAYCVIPKVSPLYWIYDVQVYEKVYVPCSISFDQCIHFSATVN